MYADACMGYLHEVDMLLDQYVEMPMYEDVFEAVDDDGTTAKNAEIESKSTSLLQKAIDAVKHIFNGIKEIIHNIFVWLGADKGELTKYQQFLKECKENPEFAGMKVTYHDYQKINAEYDNTLKKMEDEYRKFKQSERDETPRAIDDLKAGLTKVGKEAVNIGKGAGSAITVSALLNYAKANQQNAAHVQTMLAFDIGLLNEIEKELGKREVRKFKKKIKKLSSQNAIIRCIAGGRQEQAKTLANSFKEVISELDKPFSKTTRRMLKSKTVRKTGLETAKMYKDYQVGKFRDKRFAKRAYKQQMKHENKIKNAAQKEANQIQRNAQKLSDQQAYKDFVVGEAYEDLDTGQDMYIESVFNDLFDDVSGM